MCQLPVPTCKDQGKNVPLSTHLRLSGGLSHVVVCLLCAWWDTFSDGLHVSVPAFESNPNRLVPFSSCIALSSVFYLPLSYPQVPFWLRPHTHIQLKIWVWENLLISHTLIMSQSNKHREPCSTQLLNRPTDSTSEQPDAELTRNCHVKIDQMHHLPFPTLINKQ